MNNKLIGFLLLIGIILVFLILFEIILIVFSYPVYGFSKGMFKPNENLGHEVSPSYSGTQSIYGRIVKIDTNSKGMRDFREYDYERNNKTRILVLGSSYAFGNGVELEETYIELLRQSFNEEIEIINPSVPGYVMNHKYVYFINEGKKYNPDIILLTFTPNDWGDFEVIGDLNIMVNRSNYRVVNKKGYLVPSNWISNYQKVHAFLLVKSRTYTFFYSKSRIVLSSVIKKFRKESITIPYYFYEKDSIEYKEDYEGHFSLLEDLKNNTDARIIIFITPHKTDLASEEDIKKEYTINYSVDSSQSKESIKQIARDLQIEVIEVKSNDPNIFLKVDGHLTPRGNQIVSDELYLKLNDLIK